MLNRLHWLVLVMALPACVPRSIIDHARDRDDDGHDAWQLGGDDCDDADPAANPGEVELCGDGVDNDCDGVADDDGANAATWYPDLDGDGFAVDTPVTACVQPANHRPSVDAGIDCDDSLETVHPGAADTWYDGIDSDCDGHDDYDQDGDGFAAPAGGGDDCDDLSNAIHPGAAEVCGNHTDDDCDGTHNGCAWDGDVELESGPHATIVWADSTATVLQVGVGDTNDDANDDLVVHGMASGGELFLFEGPLDGTLSTSIHADVHATLTEPSNGLGFHPDLSGDLNGDGLADLLLFNTEDGGGWPTVLALAAPLRSTTTQADVTKTFYGPDPSSTPDSGFGFQGRYLGDVDGNGISTFYTTQNGTVPSVCYLQEGLGAGTSLPAIAKATLQNCPFELVPSIDFDDDGGRDYGFVDGDSFGFVSGTSAGTIDLDTTARLHLWDVGATLNAYPSDASLDGDSHADLIVGRLSGTRALAEVLFAPIPADATESHPRLVIEPADADDGYLPIGTGDVDGDGFADLVLMYVARDLVAGTGTISVDVFCGPLTPGTATPSDATTRIHIDAIPALFMQGMMADFNGDGFADVVLGGYGFAWVIYGQGR